MSASHNKRDSFVYCINKEMLEVLEPLLVSEFDLIVDDDIKQIEREAKAMKFLRRSCLVKVLSYPVEGAILWLFGSPEMREDRFLATKLYVKFLRNKITMEELNEKLSEQGREMSRRFK